MRYEVVIHFFDGTKVTQKYNGLCPIRSMDLDKTVFKAYIVDTLTGKTFKIP